MNNKRFNIFTARARSDPSLQAGVRGDPQWISALRIDPPEQIEMRGHPPEVRHIKNGSPADSARGKPPEVQIFRKEPRAESEGVIFLYGRGMAGREGRMYRHCERP